jgi:hypothetical protein
VLFKGRKFGFVHNHAKVEAFKIVIGNVVYANLVFGVAGNSQKSFQVDLGERWKALETQNRVEQMAFFQYLTE